MVKKIETTEKVTKYEYSCDDCESGGYIHTCTMCGKHICNKCIGHTDDRYGDNWEYYCKKCWSIGESYREQILKHEDEIDRLYDEWHTKCKK